MTGEEVAVLRQSAQRLTQQARRLDKLVSEGKPISASEIHDCRHLAGELNDMAARYERQENASAES